jgi:hypothetical protein
MNFLAIYVSQICSVYMCGVIWIIQVVHYPGFAKYNPSQFIEAHAKHSSAMGLLVGPVMIIEILAAFWLVIKLSNYISIINLVLVLLLWFFTFFASVPLHNRLSTGFDLEVIQKLVLTNWPRTVLWTAKAILTSYWLVRT